MACLGPYTSSTSPNRQALTASVAVGVCTIEKANALVNTAIMECSISGLNAVVLDEIHMIDDGYRG